MLHSQMKNESCTENDVRVIQHGGLLRVFSPGFAVQFNAETPRPSPQFLNPQVGSSPKVTITKG